MSGIQIAEAKAPWVMFEARAVENRTASIAQGRMVYKDVDYALITPWGSRDQIERVATEWLEQQSQEAREGRVPAEWVVKYEAAYRAYKDGKALPLEGTPIGNWPVLSPAQVKMLQEMHILTIESLANANEEMLRRIGMGGRALCQKAQDFISAADGPGKLTMQMEALRSENGTLSATVKTQSEQIAALSIQVQALAAGRVMTEAAPAMPQGNLQAVDILRDDDPDDTATDDPLAAFAKI